MSKKITLARRKIDKFDSLTEPKISIRIYSDKDTGVWKKRIEFAKQRISRLWPTWEAYSAVQSLAIVARFMVDGFQ